MAVLNVLVDRGPADVWDVLADEAHAGRLGTARISIELLPWGDDRTVVIMDEHPLTGPGARWHSMAVEALLRFRNERMLRTLARIVHARHPR